MAGRKGTVWDYLTVLRGRPTRDSAARSGRLIAAMARRRYKGRPWAQWSWRIRAAFMLTVRDYPPVLRYLALASLAAILAPSGVWLWIAAAALTVAAWPVAVKLVKGDDR